MGKMAGDAASGGEWKLCFARSNWCFSRHQPGTQTVGLSGAYTQGSCWGMRTSSWREPTQTEPHCPKPPPAASPQGSGSLSGVTAHKLSQGRNTDGSSLSKAVLLGLEQDWHIEGIRWASAEGRDIRFHYKFRKGELTAHRLGVPRDPAHSLHPPLTL